MIVISFNHNYIFPKSYMISISMHPWLSCVYYKAILRAYRWAWVLWLSLKFCISVLEHTRFSILPIVLPALFGDGSYVSRLANLLLTHKQMAFFFFFYFFWQSPNTCSFALKHCERHMWTIMQPLSLFRQFCYDESFYKLSFLWVISSVRISFLRFTSSECHVST